jgi:hypothetical protein
MQQYQIQQTDLTDEQLLEGLKHLKSMFDSFQSKYGNNSQLNTENQNGF